MKKIYSALLIIVLAMVSLALADNGLTPTTPPEGVLMASADIVKIMIKKKDIHVYDMRTALNYGKGHLPQARSLPYKWTPKGSLGQSVGEFNLYKLPLNKKATIVFHSDGPTEWKSYYASQKAAEAGYKDVIWMRDGYSTWNEKGYSIEH